jgi:hypothetical protein
MPAKVALGWNVKNAFVASTARILATDHIWTTDYRPGLYPGWGWNAAITAECESMMAAVMPWISSGKRYLVIERAHQAGDAFGSLMEAYVVAAGGTFTRTGTSGGFGGYDWADYDVICATSTANAGEASAFDAAIAAGRSAIVTSGYGFTRYGVTISGYLTADFGPNYFGNPFDCAPLGLVAKELVCYSSYALVAGTNTMGGTYTRYLNDVGEGTVGIWLP